MSQHNGEPAPIAGNKLNCSAVDAVIVTTPLSPTDTQPPAGPAILATCAHRRELSVRPFDLNIRYLNRFKEHSRGTTSGVPVGDQNKDRDITHAAKTHFLMACPLATSTPLHAADGVNPVLGMNFSFEDIASAVEGASRPGHFWHDFIEATLFREVTMAPRILGLSIMGPPQLFISMVVAFLAASRWPNTVLLAGGSHVTLLREHIAGDARYGKFFDGFMPHHCEEEFADLLLALRRGEDWRIQPGVLIAGSGRPDSLRAPRRLDFEIAPSFTAEELLLYSAAGVTIPLQLTRGCNFGKCAHCTYPKAEPAPTGFDRLKATRAVDVIERFVQAGFSRFSIKDSLFTPTWMKLLAEELLRRRIGAEWSCTTLVDVRQESRLIDAIRFAARAGLRTIEFGVETIHPHLQAVIGKVQPLELVERVIGECAAHRVHAVVNLIYGLPGESIDEARAQRGWLKGLEGRFGSALVSGSHNLLEVDLDTPMQRLLASELQGRAPWAFNFAWTAPLWRGEFRSEMNEPGRREGSWHRPPLIVITGPGGAGKSTVAQALCEMPGFRRHLSVTTRRPREGVGKPEYQHITLQEFCRLRDAGRLIDEHESPSGNQYGLTAPETTPIDVVPVLVSSAAGVARIRATLQHVWRVIVVLMDEPDEVLAKRMRERGDHARDIQQRLSLAQFERTPVGGAELTCSGCDALASITRICKQAGLAQ